MIKNMAKAAIILIILATKEIGKMIYFMVLDIGNKFLKLTRKN